MKGSAACLLSALKCASISVFRGVVGVNLRLFCSTLPCPSTKLNLLYDKFTLLCVIVFCGTFCVFRCTKVVQEKER